MHYVMRHVMQCIQKFLCNAVHTRDASRAADPPSLPGVSARSPSRSDAASREPMQQGAAQVARHEGGGVARIEARWRRLEEERERDEQAATVLWAAELEAARRDAFVLVPVRDIVVHEDAPHYAPKLSRKRLRERRAARKEKALMRLRTKLPSAVVGQALRQCGATMSRCVGSSTARAIRAIRATASGSRAPRWRSTWRARRDCGGGLQVRR